MSSANSNPYIPYPVTIRKITIENEARDLKTFELAFKNKEDEGKFKYQCGQFAILSVAGVGESPIGIASSPLDEGHVDFTVKKYPTGCVTSALHDMEEGDVMGLRGPCGKSYPMEEMKGKNIVIVAGGFAFTTLRSTIRYMLDKKNRKDYKDITVVYGARSPGELIYKEEMQEWQKRKDIDVHLTVDAVPEGDTSWKGKVGFVPAVTQEVGPRPENAVVLVCGPPIMIKFTLPPLVELGFTEEQMIFSLERRMTCGVGKCGKCNVGHVYVCKDGPVFTYAQLKELPEAIF